MCRYLTTNDLVYDRMKQFVQYHQMHKVNTKGCKTQQRDRQTDRQTDKWMKGKENWQHFVPLYTCKLTDSQKEIQTDRYTD